MLSLALLTGPLALLLELMTRLGITAVGLSYRVPLPAFLVHLPANEYINAALHDAVIDVTYFAISDRLLFLSLLLLCLMLICARIDRYLFPFSASTFPPVVPQRHGRVRRQPGLQEQRVPRFCGQAVLLDPRDLR